MHVQKPISSGSDIANLVKNLFTGSPLNRRNRRMSTGSFPSNQSKKKCNRLNICSNNNLGLTCDVSSVYVSRTWRFHL